MEKKLNICLVSGEFPSSKSVGGIGSYTYNLASGLSQVGHNVFVITKNKTDINTDNFRIISLKNSNLIFRAFGKLFDLIGLHQTYTSIEFSLGAFLNLRSLNKKYKIDFVEGPEWRGQLFFISFFSEIPYVVRLHGFTKKILELDKIKLNPDFYLLNLLEKITLIRSKLILAASKKIKNDSLENFGINSSKIKLLELPIDTDLFKPGQSKRSKSVLFVGRLEEKKGIFDLFDVIPDVLEKLPDTKFIFVGTDSNYKNSSMKKYLMSRAYKKSFSNNIQFLKKLSYKELPKIYRSSGVFVNPSNYESFGLTVSEALATNTPVVLYNSLGISEFAGKHNLGTIINKKALLAETIIKKLESKEEPNTARFIKEFLSSKKIAAKTVQLYQGVVNEK